MKTDVQPVTLHAVVKVGNYRCGVNCRLEVGPLSVVVGLADVVTGPHGQSFL